MGLLILYAMILLVGGVFGWRSLSLWSLPAIGDPFDVEKYGRVEVPAADNAMVRYREAAKKLITSDPSNYKVAKSKAWEVLDWATADPEVRRWVEDNRSAFAIWLEGTDRPDSLFVEPRELSSRLPRLYLVRLQEFARLAALEASRLEEAGDVEGAWRLNRATLRSSRHAGMHGGMFERHLGLRILALIQPGVQSWAEDPRVTPAMLRRAIVDVEACKRMTPPMSEMIRCDYFRVRAVLEHPDELRAFHRNGSQGEWDWSNHYAIVPEMRRFLMREPERSRRILDLVVAGQLAQCDRPRPDRPTIHSTKYSIYDIDDRTPPAVAAMAPEDLSAWTLGSAFALVWGGGSGGVAKIESEPGVFDSILLGMAERAYQIEHGKPAKTYGDLLGSYLKTLPEEIKATDQISATSGSN